MATKFHLENSYVTFNDSKKAVKFVSRVKTIENYKEFFDCLDKEYDVTEWDTDGAYELTYDPYTTLSCDSVETLVKNVLELAVECDCNINMKLTIYDDGDFLLYWIVKDNKIIDITRKINKSIESIENKAVKSFIKSQ